MSRFKKRQGVIISPRHLLEAHRDAYKKGVIHRDISAGNKRVGLLTDWELSERTSAPNAPRQRGRIGTWQFMSAFLLNNPFAAISIPDEVEAFFHILLFYVIRFLPHNCPDVGQFVHDYFDGFQLGVGLGEYYCGQHKQMAVMSSRIMLSGGMKLDIYPHASCYVLFHLSVICARRLYRCLGRGPFETLAATTAEEEVLTGEKWDDVRLRKQALKLEDHDRIIVFLDWPKEDKIADQLRADYNPKKDRVGTPEQHDAPPTTASQGAQTRSMRTRSLALPSRTASGSGQKRFLARDVEEDEEDEDEARATKRYRSNGKKPSGPGAKGKGKGRRS
ncbi:hypothetical protein C8T65DRAFT_832745 [Cerioporus squamosus]|nr:hypothetical protein C8T65DRAFT_832745 [Cerioporus squamosus]